MDVWKSMVSGKAMQEHMEDVYHNKLKVCSTSSLESYPHPLACLQMLSLLLSRISYVGCTCTCSHQFIHVFVHFQTLQQPWLPSNARLYYSDMKACDYLHYQEDWCTIDRAMTDGLRSTKWLSLSSKWRLTPHRWPHEMRSSVQLT